MAERIMLRLGDFNFEIATAAYQKYIGKQGARWAEQERLGRAPALQYVGQATPEITLDGVCYPGALGTGIGNREASIIPLRTIMAKGKPVSMVSGIGDVCGLWVITDVTDTRTVLLDNGEPRKLEFSVTLKSYGPDATGQPGPTSYGAAGNAGKAGPAGATWGTGPNASPFPAGLSQAIADLPVIDVTSPLAAVAAVASTVGEVVQTVTTATNEIVGAVTGLASEIVGGVIGGVVNAIPQPVLGVIQDVVRGAEAVRDLGYFVDDTLSAIKAVGYAGQADPRATLGSLHKGMGHIAATTRLIGHTVNTGIDILDRTATTWDAVNGLSDAPQPSSSVADLCRRAIGIAENLTGLCLRTDIYASALRDKVQVDGGELSPEDEDARRERIFAALTDVKDIHVRCLPEMANGEAEKSGNIGNFRDQQGWLYLADMSTKWLHGRGKAMPDDKKHNGWQEPYFVDWNWLMQYERFSNAVNEMKKKDYLFSPAAQANITIFLKNENAFTGNGKTFNHIGLGWDKLRAHAFQAIPMDPWPDEVLDEEALKEMNFKPDGLQVVLAKTTIFALARGRTEPLADGKWRVIVEKTAFFIHDGFEFSGNQWLGNWICTKKEKGFDIFGERLGNQDFRMFRTRTGYGCDFRTMCIPEVVLAEEFYYDVHIQ